MNQMAVVRRMPTMIPMLVLGNSQQTTREVGMSKMEGQGEEEGGEVAERGAGVSKDDIQHPRDRA